MNPTPAKGVASNARREALILAALIACVSAAAFVHALDLASRLAQTSDSAQGLVAGHAVLSGNVFLTGWRFPMDDYYFTDTLPYSALEWLLGPRPFLLMLMPALIYAMLVLAASLTGALAQQAFGRRVEAVLTVAFLVACPVWVGNWDPLLFSGFHVASTFAAFIAISLCVLVEPDQARHKVLFLSGCAALVAATAATVASDPFSLVFAFGPAVLILAIDAASREGTPPLALVILTTGVVSGLLLPAIIASAGDGFATQNSVVFGLAAMSQMALSLPALMCGLLTYFGANPFEPRAGIGLFLIARGIAFILAVLAVGVVARHMVGKRQASLFDRLLCGGVLSLLAACAVSAHYAREVTPESMWSGSGSIRYLVPAVFLASALAGRQIPTMLASLPAKRARNVARGLLAALAALIVVGGDWPSRMIELQPRWIENNPALDAAGWLERHQLKQGVGEYWSANLITAMSGNAVQIRSVGPYRGRLIPYVWVQDRRLYKQTPQFVIWQEPNPAGITYRDVRATYSVCALSAVAGYRVAVLQNQTRPFCDSGASARMDSHAAWLRRRPSQVVHLRSYWSSVWHDAISFSF